MKVCEYTTSELEAMPTLCTGQCCSLKVSEPRRRVWVCRVAGGVSVEHYNPKSGRWETALGDCYNAQEATDGLTFDGEPSFSDDRR